MSSTWGDKIKISVFGESHGKGIGVVIDGLPSGHKIDMEQVYEQMARRAPGKDKTATPRFETDIPTVLSGMLNDVTTGAPICAVIENNNTKSGDYSNLLDCPRPGHSDYPAYVRYKGQNDIRGGGHFSGRLTAPIVFAGALCRQILEKQGIHIAAHIASVGPVKDKSFYDLGVFPDENILKELSKSRFALIDKYIEENIRQEVANAAEKGDSVGGTVECIVTGVKAGYGNPMFGGVENIISSIVFGIPAIKGIEFGKGFELSEMHGSESNDPFEIIDGNIQTKSNNCGGILGGITNGMPIVFKAAVKPTASISIEQDTVSLSGMKNAKLSVKGRHDPCIVPRAVPVVEAAAALAVAQLVL